jgi:hypothetical protein
MFTNSAFTNPEQALEQFKNYVTGLQVNQGWQPSLVNQLIGLASDTYTQVKSWFKTDTEETKEFWSLLASGSPSIFDEITNGNPMSIPKYTNFMSFLASASDTSFTVDQNTGVSGVVNVAQNQLEEVAADITEEKKKFQKASPILIPALVLGGLFVVIKALK